jgi:hypothetical protein
MDHMWERVGSQLIARVSGPMKFRLVLQPCMAAFFAIRAGLIDAKLGNRPYFWALLFPERRDRATLSKDGWKSVGRVIILAVILDVIYQIWQIHFVYIGEAFIVAFVLALLPYLILRGLVTRLFRKKETSPTQSANTSI